MAEVRLQEGESKTTLSVGLGAAAASISMVVVPSAKPRMIPLSLTTALVSCSVGFRDNFLIGLVVTLSPAGVDTLEVKTSCHRCGNPRIGDAMVLG